MFGAGIPVPDTPAAGTATAGRQGREEGTRIHRRASARAPACLHPPPVFSTEEPLPAAPAAGAAAPGRHGQDKGKCVRRRASDPAFCRSMFLTLLVNKY